MKNKRVLIFNLIFSHKCQRRQGNLLTNEEETWSDIHVVLHKNADHRMNRIIPYLLLSCCLNRRVDLPLQPWLATKVEEGKHKIQNTLRVRLQFHPQKPSLLRPVGVSGSWKGVRDIFLHQYSTILI